MAHINWFAAQINWGRAHHETFAHFAHFSLFWRCNIVMLSYYILSSFCFFFYPTSSISMHKQHDAVSLELSDSYIYNALYLVIFLSCNFRVSQHFYSLSIKALSVDCYCWCCALVYRRDTHEGEHAIPLPHYFNYCECVDFELNIYMTKSMVLPRLTYTNTPGMSSPLWTLQRNRMEYKSNV